MAQKALSKEQKERSLLKGVVELYLESGSPIGSQTLKNQGFSHMSAATIRNYCARLEAQGFLRQHHTSGGRVPTAAAYKYYASLHRDTTQAEKGDVERLSSLFDRGGREVGRTLHHACERLSALAQGAIFLSSPRFDHDLIVQIQLTVIDSERCLCILVTDFGLVRTEILYTPQKLSAFAIKRIERYFRFRMTGVEPPVLSPTEETLASALYHEILLRYIANYSNSSAEELYKTGFSQLLRYSEFRDTSVLATGLALFENTAYIQTLLAECMEKKSLQFWIGPDIAHPSLATSHSSIIAVPYLIHGKVVGGIAFLGPIRTPYPKLFGLMHTFANMLSGYLVHALYKHHITYRQPTPSFLPMHDTPLSALKPPSTYNLNTGKKQ